MKLKEKKYDWCFLMLKTSNKVFTNVFTGFTSLRKMSMINLEVKMQEEWYK